MFTASSQNVIEPFFFHEIDHIKHQHDNKPHFCFICINGMGRKSPSSGSIFSPFTWEKGDRTNIMNCSAIAINDEVKTGETLCVRSGWKFIFYALNLFDV